MFLKFVASVMIAFLRFLFLFVDFFLLRYGSCKLYFFSVFLHLSFETFCSCSACLILAFYVFLLV